MDLIKTFFPYAFKDTKTNNGLVISILIHIIGAAVVCVVCALLGWVFGLIPVLGSLLGLILGIIRWVVGVYAGIGIVLAVLNRFNIIG